jgi:hypothetical protein
VFTAVKNQSSPTAPVGSPGQFAPIRGIASNPKVELGREVAVQVSRPLPRVLRRTDDARCTAAPAGAAKRLGGPYAIGGVPSLTLLDGAGAADVIDGSAKIPRRTSTATGVAHRRACDLMLLLATAVSLRNPAR